MRGDPFLYNAVKCGGRGHATQGVPSRFRPRFVVYSNASLNIYPRGIDYRVERATASYVRQIADAHCYDLDSFREDNVPDNHALFSPMLPGGSRVICMTERMISRVGCVLYRSCTTYHSGRLGPE